MLVLLAIIVQLQEAGSNCTTTCTLPDSDAAVQADSAMEASPPPEGEATLYCHATLPPLRPPPDPAAAVPEDPENEFDYVSGEMPRTHGPRMINVGIPGPGIKANLWRRAWRDKILPAVVNFEPDLILVSAGFDAHRKDEINFQFVGIREHDYAWVTDQIVQVWACCSVPCL